MRSMVEGASKLPRQCRCRNHTAADAPPTALRAVPLPAIAGRDGSLGRGCAARTFRFAS